MRILRILGLILMLVAAGLAARDLWLWQAGGEPARVQAGELDLLGSGRVPLSAGELWYMLAPQGPNTAQSVVQRWLHPAIWDRGVVPLLLSPAFVVFLGLGLIVYLPGRLLARRRRRRFR